MTDNVAAGQKACQYIVDQLNGKGDVIIINGPGSSSLQDRYKGCKTVLKPMKASKFCPKIKTVAHRVMVV